MAAGRRVAGRRAGQFQVNDAPQKRSSRKQYQVPCLVCSRSGKGIVPVTPGEICEGCGNRIGVMGRAA